MGGWPKCVPGVSHTCSTHAARLVCRHCIAQLVVRPLSQLLSQADCLAPCLCRAQPGLAQLRLPRAATRLPYSTTAAQPSGHQHHHHLGGYALGWAWLICCYCRLWNKCVVHCLCVCVCVWGGGGGGGAGRQRRRRLRGGGVGSANCQLTLVTPLADTFTTVLLPEEEEDSGAELEFGLALSPRRPDRQSGSSGAPSRPAGLQGGEDEEVVVPLSAQVQARLEGVCVQLDTFQAAAEDAARHATGAADSNAAAAASTLHSRLALLIRTLEVRDSFQPRKGGGAGSAAAAAAAATGWAGLRRMLGYHASVHRVRHPRSSQVQLVVEAIQAEPGTGKWAGHGPG